MLAGLAGAGWLGALATAGAAQTAVMPSGLPLYFEANPGQADSPAQFIARGRDSQFLISPDAAQFVLRKTTAPGDFFDAGGADAIRRRGRAARNCPARRNCPAKSITSSAMNRRGWQTGVPTFARVRVGGHLSRRQFDLLRQPAAVGIRFRHRAGRGSRRHRDSF